MKKILVLAAISCLLYSASAQPKIARSYSGGHGCVDLDLTLYADSTYLFERGNALPFPHTLRRKGAYLFGENEIHLYQFRRLRAIIPFRRLKYKEYIYEMDDDHIYLYDRAEIKNLPTEDQNFIRDYNTLERCQSY